MRIVVNYFPNQYPPLLQLAIHDAPHRRMHHAVIQQYREYLMTACRAAKVPVPIDHPIDLAVMFVNPASPDLDNLITALYQAFDGKTLKGPSVLTDDGLISEVKMSTYWPQKKAT